MTILDPQELFWATILIAASISALVVWVGLEDWPE
jgi:hypothetical protein